MNFVYDYLISLRDELKTIQNIKSCKIGLEKGIGSKDAPFIRIIPSALTNEGLVRKLSFTIAYGFDVKNKEYEQLHELYFSVFEDIEKIATKHRANLVRMITDEDTIQTLKTAAIEFEVDLC